MIIHNKVLYNKDVLILILEMIHVAKSTARKFREKQAKQKGYDLISSQRGGQHIAIQTGTKMTKTKQSKLLQNKHKKRNASEMEQSYCAFLIPICS